MSDNFTFSKSRESNVIKSIRFPEDLNEEIYDIVNKANKGKKSKQYSFNGFVVDACRFAIKHMNIDK